MTGRYRNAADLRRALETRLKQDADRSGTDLARSRRLVAFDRMAARLAEDRAGGWVLKGGAAMEFRLTGRARTTKDLDLSLRPADGSDAEGHGVRELLIDALAADLDADGFRFRVGPPGSRHEPVAGRRTARGQEARGSRCPPPGAEAAVAPAPGAPDHSSSRSLAARAVSSLTGSVWPRAVRRVIAASRRVRAGAGRSR